ncbi:DUF92 domain-containing protein [Paenibacillus eucommiae]|uniref:Uncharacterized protein (TIGR00297 family) n=1 Tax=Paenibacillus eucommiae TaxID=1355755 RepID=A0ABS4INZ7_9BACL|nr:DUF92 domain-containing protein [Paenibacillus eucommiae]MBP1989286.1 uncharacterized protein (TIGR00297 family) [Paenibacillus eucommiae]
MTDWLIGLVGSLTISLLAYRKRSLSVSGALAAVILGTLMYVFGSLAWFGTLIAFFISSSLLSSVKRKLKAAAESGYAKSGRRDAAQVAANGGIGLLLCIINAVWPDPVWWAAYVGVMATVTSDTWATEIGGLSRSLPRSVITGKQVAAGTSGGITWLGTGASAVGGLFIGVMVWLFAHLDAVQLVPLLFIGMMAGLIGALSDSWLGAILQVMYRCSVCGKEVEKHTHCEASCTRIRGAAWMTNDAVNAISSLAGGAASILFFYMFNIL